MANVFVSHSSLDNAKAQELFDWLQSQGHEHIFLDVDTEAGLLPGEDWERRLYREIDRAQAVIVLLTKHWMASKWCFAEFTHARALGKKIFPVIDTPTGERLVGSDLQAIDLTTEREGGLQRLSRAISDTALASPQGFRLRDGVSPFPGLDAFGSEQAAVFFGRDDAINALMERFRHARALGGSRFIPIVGGSGSGKSSLLRAGLLPRLSRDRANWQVLKPFRPEADPGRRLARTLAKAAAGSAEEDQRDELVRNLLGPAPADALRGVATAIRDAAGQPDMGILIAIDQFEEVFTLAPQEARNAFFALLSQTLGADLPFFIVASMRSEFLAALQAVSELPQGFEPFSLRPMPLERLDQIVKGPARVTGIEVEEAMLAALRGHVQSSQALPLVAFTLRRLFDAQKTDGRLTLASYQALGEGGAGLNPIENAIRQVAEAAVPVSSSGTGQTEALRRAFVDHLVTVDYNGNFVRTLAPESSLSDAKQAIDQLVAARLLVRRSGTGDESIGGETGSEAVVEVAHEALFTVWDRLAGWLSEEKDFLTGRTLIGQQLAYAKTLDDRTHGQGLLSDVLLERARSWLETRPKAFNEEERAFIDASIVDDDRRKRQEADRKARVAKLQRRLTIGACAAALVFLVLGGVAWWQRGIATQALDAGTQTANQVAIELARDFRDQDGMRSELVSDILGRAIDLQRQMAALGGDTDALRAQTATALSEIALAHLQSGSAEAQAGLAAAKSAAEEALELLDPLVAASSGDSDIGTAWINASIALGDVLRREGDLGQAEARFRAALELAESDEQIAAAGFEAVRIRALAMNRVGDMRMRADDAAAARSLYQQSLDLREGLQRDLRSAQSDDRQDADDETALIRDLAISHAKLAGVDAAEGNFTSADRSYQTSLALRRQLVVRAPTDTGYRRDLAAAHQLRGRAAAMGGDPIFARNSYAEAARLFRELALQDPGRADWQEGRGVALESVADADRRLGNLEAAAETLAEVVDIFRALQALDPRNAEWRQRLGVALTKSGGVAWQRDNLPSAQEQLGEARGYLEDLAEEQPGAIAIQRSLIFMLLTISQTAADPLPDLRQAQETVDRLRAEGLIDASTQRLAEQVARRLGAFEQP
ncbi:MAG: toll/interleukin-1 receptor domain-containing protein [Pseudomonadota bacterium]